jgi:Kdo2-lipid IVA lauroyltransferase/acyltransferase
LNANNTNPKAPPKTPGYYLLTGIARIISLLPMAFWNWLSWLLFVLLYRVTKYRKRVVMVNLQNAFPQKSQVELKQIAQSYYKHLGQIMIDNMYLRFASLKSLPHKITLKNPELLDNYYQQGRSAILMFGHNGNWEYSGALVVKTKYLLAPVYKQLSSKTFDAFYYNMRCQYGVNPIEMRDVVRRFVPLTKNSLPYCLCWPTNRP